MYAVCSHSALLALLVLVARRDGAVALCASATGYLAAMVWFALGVEPAVRRALAGAIEADVLRLKYGAASILVCVTSGAATAIVSRGDLFTGASSTVIALGSGATWTCYRLLSRRR